MGMDDGPVQPSGGGVPTVLFVDDESQMLEIYERTYGSEFTVLTAEGGEAALRAFGDHVDFAFVDRRMPDVAGDDVVRRLRDRGYETPVGFLSAISPETEPDVDHVAYLTKPPTREQVRKLVDRHVS